MEAVDAGMAPVGRTPTSERFADLGVNAVTKVVSWGKSPRQTGHGVLHRDEPQQSMASVTSRKSAGVQSLGMTSSNSAHRKLLTTQRASALATDVAQLITFTDKALLRASDLQVVLRFAGRIFRNSAGTADTYELSEPVSGIDFFVSHNWVVARYKKFITLAVHFNFGVAAMFAAMFIITLLVLSYHRMLPVVENSVGEPSGFVASVATIPVFLVALVSIRDVPQVCCRRRRQHVFLDKTCIHQTDHGLKQVGILKLGAFLYHSQRMVVLYSDLYLRKLWTVYEVAAFLSLRPVDRMIVLPVDKAVTFCATIATCYMYQILGYSMWLVTGSNLTFQMLGVLLAAGYVHVNRGWLRKRRAMLDTVASFTLEGCLVFDESERQLIYQTIALLMRASGAVDEDGDQRDCLDAFEGLVRSEVANRVLLGTGRWSFNYKQYCCIGFAISGGSIIDSFVTWDWGTEGEWRMHVILCLYKLCWVVAWWPLISLLSESMARTKLHLTGCRRRLWFSFIVLFGCTVPALTLAAGALLLQEAAMESDAALAGQVAMPAIGAGVVLCILQQRQHLVAAAPQIHSGLSNLPKQCSDHVELDSGSAVAAPGACASDEYINTIIRANI